MNLTKNRMVLDAIVPSIFPGRLNATRWPDEPDEVPPVVSFTTEAWEAMGSPAVVTVTIEPGDLLNVEAV